MLNNLGGWTHAALRVGAGFLFFEHGLQKLFGALGGFFGPDGGTAPLISLMGLAGSLEFGGGLLIVLGALTRPVAALLVVEMLAAFVIAHLPQGGWPIQNQGELSLLYASIFLFLAGNGGGPLSIDAWMFAYVRGERRQIRGDRRERVVYG